LAGWLPRVWAGSGIGAVVQVQPLGQSLFVAEVVAFGAHQPGKDVVVVHTGALAPPAAGAVLARLSVRAVPPAPPLVEAGGADPDPAEQIPETDGLQMNSAPQSLSTLQGSSHLKAHSLRLVVVHVSMTVTGPASHPPLGAQTGPPPLPEQAVDVSSWQTMPAPQSASALQAFGWQLL